jgi:hypothetical protein
MAPKTQIERVDEAQKHFYKSLIGRWTIDELYEIEKEHPGRIASFLYLIGMGLADLLYEMAPLMRSEPEKLSYRFRQLIPDVDGFYTGCIEKETDPEKKMLISGARSSSMGLIRQMTHKFGVQERWNRFEKQFKANEQQFRECLNADSPSLINMQRLFKLAGHKGKYNPDSFSYPEFDLFLAWMRNEEIIDFDTYQCLA